MKLVFKIKGKNGESISLDYLGIVVRENCKDDWMPEENERDKDE